MRTPRRRRRRPPTPLLLAMALGFVLGRSWSSTPPTPPPPPGGRPAMTTVDAGPTVERLQPLSSLVTARVDVADVVEATLAGRTGSVRVAILVKGDMLLGTDLSAARFENVDPVRRTATLVLPPPTAASPRVDHDRTRVFEIRTSGLWQVVPADEGRAAVVNRAYAEAQRAVARAAENPALRDRARRQAEAVLRTFFAAAGWAVEVRWSS